MLLRNLFIAFIIFISFNSCSKKEPEYIPTEKIDPYSVYKLAYEGFEKRDFFYASKKFFEAELNFKVLELAAKSLLDVKDLYTGFVLSPISLDTNSNLVALLFSNCSLNVLVTICPFLTVKSATSST